MFKQSDNKGAEPARNCAELGFEQTRQAGVARALTSAVLFVSCGSLNSVNLSSTLSMSVLEYWNSLFCALNTMRATSQSHNTLSSMAFFIKPFLRLVKVTWRLRSSGMRTISIFFRPILLRACVCARFL